MAEEKFIAYSRIAGREIYLSELGPAHFVIRDDDKERRFVTMEGAAQHYGLLVKTRLKCLPTN